MNINIKVEKSKEPNQKLIEMLRFNHENIEVTKVDVTHDECLIHGISNTNSTVCSKCNRVIKRFKDYRQKQIKLGQINRYTFNINLKQKMYYCKDCNSCTVEQILADKNKRVTNEVLEYMKHLLANRTNYSKIARKLNTTTQTIINWFDKYISIESKLDLEDLEIIAIDEVNFMKTKQSKYQCNIYDHKQNKVASILKTRYKEEVVKGIKNVAPNLKIITQDCWPTYKNAAKEINPSVSVVLDLFHLVRYVSWDFNKARIHIAEVTGQKNVKYWKLLTKRFSKLNENGKLKVKHILEKDKELKLLYKAKEIAYSAFSQQTKKEFLSKIFRFYSFIEKHNFNKHFVRLISVLSNWKNEVLNTFKYRNLSNGKIEQVNSKMKDLKRNARGFKNFERASKLALLVVNY